MIKKYILLYSCIDIGCMKYISQSIQQRIINLFASKNYAQITFVTNEDIDSIETQIIFKSKLEDKPKVNGFIFFSIDQFCYGGINLELLKKILYQNYDLYFAKEQIILKYKDKKISNKLKELSIYSKIKFGK